MKRPPLEKGQKFGWWTVLDTTVINKRVLCRCDCSNEKMVLKNSLVGGISKNCSNCRMKRTKQTNLEKYGVEFAFQSSIVQEKIKKTNLERYGSENPAQMPDIKQKIKKTNLEKYGTEHTLQSKEVRDKGKKTIMEKYGVEYISQSPEIKAKVKNTNLEKYGVENPTQSPEIKEKTKKTNLERYGFEHSSQSLPTKDKLKKTNLERYGTEYSLQSKEVRDKAKKTITEKYGVDHVWRLPEIREKAKKTYLERYGVEYISQSPGIREKIKKTNLERYGVEYVSQSPQIQEKIRKAMAERNWRSSTELELANFIESLGFFVKKSYIGGSNPKEIDIHVPEKDLYIEFNGEYWHSEANNKTRNYHLDKTLGCLKQNNSHLIHIFESEWVNKQEIVKNFIKSKLIKGTSIRASKCLIKEIDKKEAYDFCNLYHLQGKPNSSILNLGLYFENELISVMTFSKPHRQNMGKEPHLSRYAIKPDFRVHGGLSKMSSYAFGKIGTFITYVHYRLSNGDSYEKAGYEKIGFLKPDYWYWDIMSDEFVSKQSRKKSNVKTPEGMTEKEHALIDGLFRIWDCGKIKFQYSLKSNS